jgi:MoxR-like ATPase
MMQKAELKQDMFLMGPPGARRRRLAMWWSEITGREVEYLCLSRDTTDSDLKQRREIVDGGVLFVDQPPVRAAIHGRVLILDGIEKAERNVLPTINNLLENREMNLPDGRFLVAASRYDAICADAGLSAEEALTSETMSGLVRVSDDFLVVALGLPVPAYPGFPLDPPLRSRFQGRYVGQPSLASRLSELQGHSDYARGASPLLSFEAAVEQLRTSKSQPQNDSSGTLVAATGGPEARILPFPDGAVDEAARLLQSFPPPPLLPLPGNLSGNGGSDGVGSGAERAEAALAAERYTRFMQRLLHRAYPFELLPLEPTHHAALRTISEQLFRAGGDAGAGGAGKVAAEGVGGEPALQGAEAARGYYWLEGIEKGGIEKGGIEKGHGESSSEAIMRVMGGHCTSSGEGAFTGAADHTADTRRVDMAVATGARVGASMSGGMNSDGGTMGTTVGKTIVTSAAHDEVLLEMLLDHAMGRDMCVVGPKGEGKSVLVARFASVLGYSHPRPLQLFKDMSARDLLLRRTTDAKGNTMWGPSPLLVAAIGGDIAVLDGIHRIDGDVLASVHALVTDRQLHLPDGSQLMRHDRYDQLLRTTAAEMTLTAKQEGKNSATDAATDAAAAMELRRRGVFRIHPSFRMVGVGNPPAGAARESWLTAEMMQMWSFHQAPLLSRADRENILRQAVFGGGADGAAGTAGSASANGAVGANAALALLLDTSEALHALSEGAVSGGSAGSGGSGDVSGTVATDAPSAQASTGGQSGLSIRQLLRLGRQLDQATTRMGGGAAPGGEVPGSAGSAGGAGGVLHGMDELRAVLAEKVGHVCMAAFMSPTMREEFDTLLADILDTRATSAQQQQVSTGQAVGHEGAEGAVGAVVGAPTSDVTANEAIVRMIDGVQTLQIGSAQCPVSTPLHPELVPDPSPFYHMPAHDALLEGMLHDVVGGEKAMLLIGNQGTGKNKLADRLLQLLGLEREYIQLHRYAMHCTVERGVHTTAHVRAAAAAASSH